MNTYRTASARRPHLTRLLAAAVAVPLLVGAAPAPADPAAGPARPAVSTSAVLPGEDLGTVTGSQTLARGLTHHQLQLGTTTAPAAWTVQLVLPSATEGVKNAPVGSEAVAQATADRLTAAGFDARVEHVLSPETIGGGGDLGYRVRVGAAKDKAGADALLRRVRAAGFTASSWFTGWDGPAALPGVDGPVRVNVLTLDPRRFQGSVTAEHGPDLEHPEATSELAADALAGVNGGFFVYGAAHGAPGDPAGVAAYNGKILSESVGDRPALVIDHRSGRARVERLRWEGTAAAGGTRLTLDGVNRVPGKIRNCGGLEDSPTDAPVHDVTCTDTDELVAFTPEFGASTPEGDGLEVVLDHAGRVVEVREQRGTALAAGQRSLQATGEAVAALRALAAAPSAIRVDQRYVQEDGRTLRMTPHTQVLNGGPELVRDGALHVTAARDGMVQPADPGAQYGWTHQRNPRTIAGVDAQGRLLVVTVDGRQEDSWGMSVAEAADLARRLGMVDAVNLDGGGSTTMVVGGELVNAPSGATERAVGDALVFRAR